ncbi:hypothetical protein KUA24_17 [Vibrio phage HNL01]|nr:hypothetical protein KUA24_17 [Vibrio phage HNL01]
MKTIKVNPSLKRWDIHRLNYIQEHNVKVLRYNTGSFSHSLVRLICIAHNVSYENVLQCRINDDADHWVLVLRNDKPIKPFTDEALLP